jgi:hypothetical protein
MAEFMQQDRQRETEPEAPPKDRPVDQEEAGEAEQELEDGEEKRLGLHQEERHWRERTELAGLFVAGVLGRLGAGVDGVDARMRGGGLLGLQRAAS